MSCSREREARGRDARLAHGREGGAKGGRARGEIRERGVKRGGGRSCRLRLKQRQQAQISPSPAAPPASLMSPPTLR